MWRPRIRKIRGFSSCRALPAPRSNFGAHCWSTLTIRNRLPARLRRRWPCRLRNGVRAIRPCLPRSQLTTSIAGSGSFSLRCAATTTPRSRLRAPRQTRAARGPRPVMWRCRRHAWTRSAETIGVDFAGLRFDSRKLGARGNCSEGVLGTMRPRSPIRLCAFILSAMACFDVRAATDATIEVQGNRRVDAQAIREHFHAAPDQRFTPAAIDAALKELYATGLFEDVKIVPSGARLI